MSIIPITLPCCTDVFERVAQSLFVLCSSLKGYLLDEYMVYLLGTGDRRNYKTCLKRRVNDERPTGKKTQLVSGKTVEK